MTKADLYQMLEEKQQLFFDTADAIWADPELSLSEHHAAARYTALLEELGFTVENRLAGMETAFPAGLAAEGRLLVFLGNMTPWPGSASRPGLWSHARPPRMETTTVATGVVTICWAWGVWQQPGQ